MPSKTDLRDGRGVVLDLASIDRSDLDLAPLHRVCGTWAMHAATTAAQTLVRIGDARVVVSNKVVLDRYLLGAAPSLELVCIAATGTNNLDLAGARELGIRVCNVPAYATAAVVQHVFGLILALTLRLRDYQQSIERGDWQRSGQFCLLDFPIRELAGLKLGIVGFGVLGRAVGRLGEAFGMEILIAERPGAEPRSGRTALERLLPQVDVLSLHCPLTETTRNLIGARELGLMRKDALLINTARGGIVDEGALADALRAGGIGGAGVDVLNAEPPSADNPLLSPGLPNLILTPHVAWASRESRQRLIAELASNILAYNEGRPRNVVV